MNRYSYNRLSKNYHIHYLLDKLMVSPHNYHHNRCAHTYHNLTSSCSFLPVLQQLVDAYQLVRGRHRQPSPLASGLIYLRIY